MQIDSEKIPEAVEVETPAETTEPANEQAQQTIHEALSAPTETKAPQQQNASTLWDWDKAEETPPPPPNTNHTAPPPNTPPGEPKTEAEAPKGSEKVSDTLKKQSAETATLMWDQFLQLAGNARVNSKFKKKFTKEESQKIIEHDLEDTKYNDVEEEDKVLKTKFDRLLKKRDRVILNIPLNEKEYKNHVAAFYNYFKVKDIEMPPEWALGFTLGATFIDRSIDIEFD